MKVTKNGRSMKVSSLKKSIFIEHIPAIGDEVDFYDEFLQGNCLGEITSVKDQGVTVQRDPGYSDKYVFTLRKTGEFIERGFKHYERNRKLTFV